MDWRREQLLVSLSQNNVYFIIQEMLEGPMSLCYKLTKSCLLGSSMSIFLRLSTNPNHLNTLKYSEQEKKKYIFLRNILILALWKILFINNLQLGHPALRHLNIISHSKNLALGHWLIKEKCPFQNWLKSMEYTQWIQRTLGHMEEKNLAARSQIALFWCILQVIKFEN